MPESEYKGNPLHMQFKPYLGSSIIRHQYGQMIPKNFKPHLRNNTLLRHILYRQLKNMNTFVMCVGAVRTGKSYFCLRMAELYMEEYKKKFDAEKQCSFDIKEFLKWSVTNIESCFIVDEVQLQMSPRQWYDVQHRVFNEFCDIQGWRKNTVFFPFPHIGFVDKHQRFLCNYIVRTLSAGRVLWYKVIHNPVLGKSFPDKIGTIKFSKPSPETIEIYEKMKKEFTDQHLQDSLEMLENLDKPAKRKVSGYSIEQAFNKGIINEEVFSDKMFERGYEADEIDMRIKTIQSKGNVKKYSHTCVNCSGVWSSNTENPKQCPKCNTRNWKR